MDDGLLAWTEGRRLPEGKRICIVTLDIQGDQRSSHCAPDRSIFREMTVVNNDTIAYTETSTAESPSSRPAVLGRPELEEALPQPWELRTRSVEADSEGVAWVANSPEYGGPAATYYWSDETGLLEMPAEDPTFRAEKVGLLNEAVLWMETEYANQIFAVRRGLVGCEAAVRGVVPRKLRQGSMSVLLAGTGGGRVMSIIFESDGSAHIALVPLPELPTACELSPCLGNRRHLRRLAVEVFGSGVDESGQHGREVDRRDHDQGRAQSQYFDQGTACQHAEGDRHERGRDRRSDHAAAEFLRSPLEEDRAHDRVDRPGEEAGAQHEDKDRPERWESGQYEALDGYRQKTGDEQGPAREARPEPAEGK